MINLQIIQQEKCQIIHGNHLENSRTIVFAIST